LSELYGQFIEAAGRLPHQRGLRFLANDGYRLPESEHMLPPFISVAATAYWLSPEVRAAAVEADYEMYCQEMEARINRDPVSLFGVPFTRDGQPGKCLMLANEDGDLRTVVGGNQEFRVYCDGHRVEW
jgi:hypothetical protein